MAAGSPARVSAAELVRRQSRRHEMMKVLMRSAQRVLPFPQPSPSNVLSTMVGMARCAVPARVVAGGTNIRATLAIEGVAPLHAARTSQRDVPTTLNTYSGIAGVRVWRSALVLGRSRFERGRDLGESRCFLEAE